MDFRGISENFEKQFSEKCEKMCFAGMPITILKSENLNLSASLSVGGCAALARRSDGRITVEFSGNKKYISANALEIGRHIKEPMLEFLARAQSLGAQLGGADILLQYNTELYNEYEPLLLCAMYYFCAGLPEIRQIKKCLSNPERDFVSVAGIKDTVLLQNGKFTYIKFPSSRAKIILCHIKGKNRIQKSDNKTVEIASEMLARDDLEGFGSVVTGEYTRQLNERGIERKTKYLFELSVKLQDAFGYGILEGGGIFAFVENKKVNAFVQDLKKEYETYYGTAPDFYVTQAENSGVFKIKDL